MMNNLPSIQAFLVLASHADRDEDCATKTKSARVAPPRRRLELHRSTTELRKWRNGESEPHFVYFGWRIADISDFISFLTLRCGGGNKRDMRFFLRRSSSFSPFCMLFWRKRYPFPGAHYQEPATPTISKYNGIFTDQSSIDIFLAK